jgi:hypothetical protein
LGQTEQITRKIATLGSHFLEGRSRFGFPKFVLHTLVRIGRYKHCQPSNREGPDLTLCFGPQTFFCFLTKLRVLAFLLFGMRLFLHREMSSFTTERTPTVLSLSSKVDGRRNSAASHWLSHSSVIAESPGELEMMDSWIINTWSKIKVSWSTPPPSYRYTHTAVHYLQYVLFFILSANLLQPGKELNQSELSSLRWLRMRCAGCFAGCIGRHPYR